MIAIWRQLIWKEWREQVWKMVSLAAIVFAVEVYCFFSDRKAGLAQLGLGLLCGVPGAFFVAIGVAAGERTAGSLDFLRSLPLARWKWAAVRLASGAIASLLPVMVAAGAMLFLAWAMRSATGAPRDLVVSALSGLCCVSVYAWTVAAGARQANELRAGLAAICLFVGWFVLVMLGNPSSAELNRLTNLLVLISPVGISRLPDPASPSIDSFTVYQVLYAQLAGLVATSWWFLRRYAAVTAAENRSPSASKVVAFTTLRPARRSPLAAMIWKEYREALPMCLAGMLIVAAILLPPTIGAANSEHRLALAVAASFIVFLGTIMAIVLGVGGPAADLDAGVWQFWRSRPIRPASWFGLKYITGATVLILAFDGAHAAIDLLASGTGGLLHDVMWWFGPMVHLLAYSAAVWMVCQVRQPIYAGILALAIVISLLILGEYPVDRPLLPWLGVSQLDTCRQLPLEPPLRLVVDWLATSYLPFAAPMLALSALFALLGWFAGRRSKS